LIIIVELHALPFSVCPSQGEQAVNRA